MRLERQVEIEIAVLPATPSLAALARQAQPLAVHRARRDARLHRVRDAAQHTVLVVFGNGEIELERRAAIGVLDADRRGDLEVLSRHARAPAAARASPKASEQIAEVEILEVERSEERRVGKGRR